MRMARRLAHYFLTLCVLLSLGDAPYVDEFLADLAAATAQDQSMPSVTADDVDDTVPKGMVGCSKVCQNLLNLPGVSEEVVVTLRVDDASPFVPAADPFPASAAIDRIDRPPALRA